MTDQQQLTEAIDEALALIVENPAEAAGVLQAAVAQHGYRKTAVRKDPMTVGVCSSCNGDVVRKFGKGASCPCGFVSIPETFRGVMSGVGPQAA